jgi:hypothetical protein
MIFAAWRWVALGLVGSTTSRQALAARVNIRKSLDTTRPLPVSTPLPFIYYTQFPFPDSHSSLRPCRVKVRAWSQGFRQSLDRRGFCFGRQAHPYLL